MTTMTITVMVILTVITIVTTIMITTTIITSTRMTIKMTLRMTTKIIIVTKKVQHGPDCAKSALARTMKYLISHGVLTEAPLS